MNIRTILHRRQAESVPLLPDSESGPSVVVPFRNHGRRSRRNLAEREERLERLLTPSELDLVEHRLV
ncbi:hypothetical protein A5780_04360 [Nocardia sp. 852002-20019_SCH5090214]|uniref:Uncharacterized protein n=1 Tax=Nocardia nova TaxID=37330 RepID=A0A2S5ZXF0_9NOCA|nr:MULTISPECIES: hypothetical protein [Nocardia]OBF68780.1 hypothetical protein A9X06_33295 [Mycobacterium sp. 852002-51759_SCH5129042]MBF6278681.1 hypothetical protein [Nocardia nova]MBV7701150.1 hypothetical protein [Nocardia nova]OBA41060.1 hypothetical protein A5789_00590 [Nocardia sp. 852002-51101_SCH5132738]OBA43027.1 hypothetical protein A5780_04360 [Nocardia sp. 852002-20019_SCH5090214]